MTDIFLSYAREDLFLARDLAGALDAEGWSVFWDRWIPPGRNFEEYIGERIAECQAVVVLWSPHSVTSKWVRIEAGHGRDRDVLIPALVEPAEIPFGYQQLRAADLSGWRAGIKSIEFDELVSSIGRLVPRPIPDDTAGDTSVPETPVVKPSTEADRPSAAAPDKVPGRQGSSETVASGWLVAVWAWLQDHRWPVAGAGLLAVAVVAMIVSGAWPLTRPGAGTASPAPQMVQIAGGTFEMGSNIGFSDERPTHLVLVGAFELSRSEVTVAEYRACIEVGTCDAPLTMGGCNWGVPDRDTHPVTCVSWDQARTFATWLGLRLPSEAEWDFAAGGGGRRAHPWGDSEADCARANLDGCAGGTKPACSTPSGNTPDGLCDMAGNVFEWVEDDYHSDYEGAPGTAAAWVDSPRGVLRVLRGGSWWLAPRFARVAYRSRFDPSLRYDDVGFRVARSAL